MQVIMRSAAVAAAGHKNTAVNHLVCLLDSLRCITFPCQLI